jgi:hypothetical protein
MKSISTLLIIFLILITNCAPYPEVEPAQKSNLTTGVVKQEIVKGVTTQAEVLEIFGSPNLVTKNRDDNEVWNYNKMAVTSVAGSASDIWLGSRALSTITTSSFDLILIFDDTDTVIDYSIISAAY